MSPGLDTPALAPTTTSRRGVDDCAADTAAILTALKAETAAWLRRDFAAQARHWVQSPQVRLMTTFPGVGARVFAGWDAVAAHYQRAMERFPQAYDVDAVVRRDNVNVVIGGDMAWVSYDQIGSDKVDPGSCMRGAQHELKIFHRMDGVWKLGCLVVMQRSAEYAACPLVEIDAAGRALWMNGPARERLRDHPGLVLAAGRLRARRRDREAGLREAVAWAFRELPGLCRPTAEMARAVPLGEAEDATPLHCWVILEDGKAHVAFDDAGMATRRVAAAAAVFGLSPAQVRLARLVLDGHDLGAAADRLGVSVNTLRTHLQRMFDKTGARSQAALVRALLSVEAPVR
jgi:DNA-binding CsgD family transcriptional regulator